MQNMEDKAKILTFSICQVADLSVYLLIVIFIFPIFHVLLFFLRPYRALTRLKCDSCLEHVY